MVQALGVVHHGVYTIFVSRFLKNISMKTTSLVKSFTVKLISRNISQVIQKFRKLHTMHCVRVCGNCRIFSHLQLFCENNRIHGIFPFSTKIVRARTVQNEIVTVLT